MDFTEPVKHSITKDNDDDDDDDDGDDKDGNDDNDSDEEDDDDQNKSIDGNNYDLIHLIPKVAANKLFFCLHVN